MAASIESQDLATRAAVEHFLYHEARLLDTGRLDEWLQLFSPDGTYWIPLEANQRDPYETSSIVFDDRKLLEARVRQYAHPRAHAPRFRIWQYCTGYHPWQPPHSIR